MQEYLKNRFTVQWVYDIAFATFAIFGVTAIYAVGSGQTGIWLLRGFVIYGCGFVVFIVGDKYIMKVITVLKARGLYPHRFKSWNQKLSEWHEYES